MNGLLNICLLHTRRTPSELVGAVEAVGAEAHSKGGEYEPVGACVGGGLSSQWDRLEGRDKSVVRDQMNDWALRFR